MSYADVVLEDEPELYLRLGEASMASPADSSGHGRDGTWGVAAPTAVTGLLDGDADGAQEFSGAQAATVPYGSWMDSPNALTVEAWIQLTGSGGPYAILDRDPLSNRIWQFRVYNDKLEFIVIGGTTGIIGCTSNMAVNDGERHHVAATWDGSVIRVLIDGRVDNTVSAPGVLATDPSDLRVGVNNSNPGNADVQFFDGVIDEVAYYTHALRPGRLAAHARAGTDRIYENFDGLLPSPTWAGHGNLSSVSDDPGTGVPYEITFGSGGGAVLRNAPFGENWTIELAIDDMTSGSMAGPVIMTDSGYGMGACVYHFPAGLLLCGISGYFYGSSFTNADPSDTTYRPTRIRLRRQGSSFYTQHSDDDGVTWAPENIVSFDLAFGPTKVGFGDWLGGSWLQLSEFKELDDDPDSFFQGVLSDSPVAYYRLGEASGTTAADSSGNAHHCTYGGSPILGQTGLLTGDDNTAVDFDGAGYAYLAGSWSQFNHFSVEALIKPSDLTGDNIIISRTSFADAPTNTGSRGWHLITKDENVVFGMTMTDGTFEEVTSVTDLVVGDEYHVAVTWDGTTAKILINGVVDASSTTLAGKTLNNVSGQAITLSAENGFATLANYHGVLDEVLLYDDALPEARIGAHYSLSMGGVPHALVIPVGVAEESDESLLQGPVSIPVGVAEELDGSMGIAVVTPQPLVIEVGVAEETDEALTAEPVGGALPLRVRLGKAIESEEAQQLEPMVQLPASITFPEEQEIGFPVTPSLRRTGFQLGVAIEREQVRPLRHPVVLLSGVVVTGQVQTVVLSGPTGAAVGVNTLVLDILEREPMQAPTSILVSVDGAIPNRRVNFVIDGVEVDHQTMPDGTGAALFSVPVPEEQGQKGEHVLSINQSGAVSASGIFTLQYDPDLLPTSIGPDAPPVDIPESHHPSGVRRWVLQDLMPGGLGSYVMPLNPSEMDNPAFERVLTAKHTTAVNEGQFHISEGAVRPLEWSFKGYCPTQEMAETLRAYAELKRRFYVIDHRGRAWVVVVTQGEIVPRLQEQNIYGDLTDWVHDYTISAVIFDRAELD